jgi:hypothetical protein
MNESQEKLLRQLFALVPAPQHPVATSSERNDCESVEEQLGTGLPGDYKAIGAEREFGANFERIDRATCAGA